MSQNMHGLINYLFGVATALAQTGTVEKVASETENQLTGLITFIFTQVPLWITAVIVIIASFIAARVVKSAVENKMTAEGFEEEHKEIQIVAGRTANAAVLLIGITVGLKIGGLDLTPVLAAGAFGIGFALQDLIMNFLAGVMILTARHYTIGDIIKVNGTMGRIIEIQTRATILKAFDGTKIVVPNADLFKNQVTSYTSNAFRRIQLANGVAYGSDLKKTKQVILDAVKATKGVLVEPKPSIWFFEWGDSSINFKVNAWVDSKSGWINTRTQLIININKALEDAGIEIPFPTQTVLMKNQDDSDDPQLEKNVIEAMVKKEAPSTQSMQGINVENMEAPAWLKKTAQSMAEEQSIASNQKAPTAPEVPVGIAIQTQTPVAAEPEAIRIEIPMGVAPQAAAAVQPRVAPVMPMGVAVEPALTVQAEQPEAAIQHAPVIQPAAAEQQFSAANTATQPASAA